MKIIELRQTCCYCPEQYEGITECGKSVYARERGGYISIDLNDETYFEDFDPEQKKTVLEALHNHFEIPNDIS